jgi:CRISPR system Cascade subunit CasE
MYLSRLILNPRSHQVLSEINNLYEMHRTLSRAFQGGRFHMDRRQEEATDILFRLDMHPRNGSPSLLVQSRAAPDWSFLCASGKDYLLTEEGLPVRSKNPAVKEIHLELTTGQMLAFRLNANPTVKKDREGHKQGFRLALLEEDQQIAWLQRKLRSAGGRLISVTVAPAEKLNGSLRSGEMQHDLTIFSVQFDGFLQVDDVQLLMQAVQTGIGPAKSFGCGLLSLAPAA